jgi:hypothetical protein
MAARRRWIFSFSDVAMPGLFRFPPRRSTHQPASEFQSWSRNSADVDESAIVARTLALVDAQLMGTESPSETLEIYMSHGENERDGLLLGAGPTVVRPAY